MRLNSFFHPIIWIVIGLGCIPKALAYQEARQDFGQSFEMIIEGIQLASYRSSHHISSLRHHSHPTRPRSVRRHYYGTRWSASHGAYGYRWGARYGFYGPSWWHQNYPGWRANYGYYGARRGVYYGPSRYYPRRVTYSYRRWVVHRKWCRRGACFKTKCLYRNGYRVKCRTYRYR